MPLISNKWKRTRPNNSRRPRPQSKTENLLTATSTDFDKWTAHPEVGEGEHGSGEEHGEHDTEGDSEHDGENDEHN